MRTPMHMPASFGGQVVRSWQAFPSKRIVFGILHRRSGPAVESPDGRKEWWLDGRFQAMQAGESGNHNNGPLQHVLGTFPGYEDRP